MPLLLELIERIPGTFWGVVIGALFSLTGVAITNRSNLRRQREQLDHDRTEKARQREFEMRREALLNAIDTTVAANKAVASITDLNKSLSEVTEEYRNKANAYTRLMAIANETALDPITPLHVAQSRKLFELTAARLPLEAQQQRIASVDGLIAQSSQKRDEFCS